MVDEYNVSLTWILPILLSIAMPIIILTINRYLKRSDDTGEWIGRIPDMREDIKNLCSDVKEHSKTITDMNIQINTHEWRIKKLENGK